jgi:N6-adenosine-specific RNA methylase IME4
MFPNAPRCELFARSSRSGWETWGDEETKFDAQLRIVTPQCAENTAA